MGQFSTEEWSAKGTGVSAAVVCRECTDPGEPLSTEQIRRIRSLWDQKPIHEIAGIVGAGEASVRHFAKTHYLFLKYLR